MKPHPNYIKSSNLMFITAGLGVINLFFFPGILSSALVISTAIITLLFLFALGWLIRQGFSWVKYPFLIIMILGLLGVPFMIKNMATAPVVGIVNVIQTVFQVWALVLLFKIPKEAN